MVECRRASFPDHGVARAFDVGPLFVRNVARTVVARVVTGFSQLLTRSAGCRARIARITGITRVLSCTRITWVARIARITCRARVTRIARVARIFCRARVARIGRVARSDHNRSAVIVSSCGARGHRRDAKRRANNRGIQRLILKVW